MAVYIKSFILEDKADKNHAATGEKLSHGFDVFDERWTFQRCDPEHVGICCPDDRPRVPQYDGRQTCTSILPILCRETLFNYSDPVGVDYVRANLPK